MPWPPPCRSPALPDQHRPAHMRDDETHAPARLGIDEALLLAPKNSEQRKARRRFVDGGRKLLRITVRLYPLLVETRFHEFGVWHAIFDAVDLPDIEHKLAGRQGIDPHTLVEVTWYCRVVPRDPVEKRFASSAHGVLPIERCRRAADECRRLLQHLGPQGPVERCGIDSSDQVGKDCCFCGHLVCLIPAVDTARAMRPHPSIDGCGSCAPETADWNRHLSDKQGRDSFNDR